MFILDLILLVLVPGIPVEEQIEIPVVIDPLAEIELLEEVEAYVLLTSKQELLADLGWYEGSVDGIRGPLTEEAIDGFTSAADVEVDDGPELLLALKDDSAPHAPEPEPVPPPAPAQSSPPSSPPPSGDGRYGVGEPWATLAECESGNWINRGASFERGSARWDYGITFVHAGYEQFQGGLNFHPQTWQSFKDPDMPDHAGRATPQQQVVVGKRVLAAQGWGAWPTCARKIGLR